MSLTVGELVPSQQLAAITLDAAKGPQLKTMGDVWTIAQVYWNAGMVPKNVKSASQLLLILIAGSELGFGPNFALRNIAVFNQQAMLHTDGPIALVRKSNLMAAQRDWTEGEWNKDNWTRFHESLRKGDPSPIVRSFSLGEARLANLIGKDVWRLYWPRMVFMRARAYNLRDNFADALGGFGILEEHLGHDEQPSGTTGSEGLLAALTGGAPLSGPPPADIVDVAVSEVAGEVGIEAPETPKESPAAVNIGEPVRAKQVRELAEALTKYSLEGDRARAFVGWVIAREVDTIKGLSSDEATLLLSWSSEQWELALDEYRTVESGALEEAGQLFDQGEGS